MSQIIKGLLYIRYAKGEFRGLPIRGKRCLKMRLFRTTYQALHRHTCVLRSDDTEAIWDEVSDVPSWPFMDLTTGARLFGRLKWILRFATPSRRLSPREGDG
jgi:hypothetical protein